MKSSMTLLHWATPSDARGAHFLNTATAKLAAALVILGATGSAIAQPDMGALLQRKYDILQQQADTDRMRAEAEIKQNRLVEGNIDRSRARSTRYNASNSPQLYVVPMGGDSLAGTDAPTYRLGNGVLLRASGIFWPDAPTVCIANCPQVK